MLFGTLSRNIFFPVLYRHLRPNIKIKVSCFQGYTVRCVFFSLILFFLSLYLYVHLSRFPRSSSVSSPPHFLFVFSSLKFSSLVIFMVSWNNKILVVKLYAGHIAAYVHSSTEMKNFFFPRPGLLTLVG